MRHTLSSPFTFFWKFLAWPLLLLAFLGLAIWRRGATPPTVAELAVGVLSLGTICVWLLFLFAPLKKVSIDDAAVYVSNYRTEIRVPLPEVIEVRQNNNLKWFLLDVYLRHPTPLGQHIVFRPRLRLYQSAVHPIVKELRERCDRARGQKVGTPS